jgi:UDP-N-acetylmuramate dehydrogenase
MTVKDAERRLKAVLAGEVRRNEPMARHTTMRVGGPADLFVVCDTLADLRETLRVAEEEALDHVVVGKGSNLLVGDGGFRGVVVTLGREFKSHRVDGDRIKAGAACILAYVVRDAFAHGLEGLEFAVGIPGTVGGALVMNAGTREQWMQRVVESVTVLDRAGDLARLRGNEIAWGYRRTDLPERGVIVEAVLALRSGDPERIRREMEWSLNRRKATQPIALPSAGSAFANPDGDSAGRLIESVGLKGHRIGGARISDVHANFIVNDGGATATDVARLMALAQTRVREAYGIELRPEIRFIGAFD